MTGCQLKDITLLIEGNTIDTSGQGLHGDIQLRKLPHQNGAKLFFEYKNELYELQVVQPRKFGAWFISQRVSSSKCFYTGNRIDPRFLLLPFFEKAKVQYTPLNQVITSVEGYYLMPLTNAKSWKMEEICDVNDKIDDEIIFYRFNIDKTINWLKSKVQRIAKTLLKHRLSKAATSNPSFSSNFDISGQSNKSTTSTVTTTESEDIIEPQDEDVRLALDILSEYISDNLLSKLLAAYGFTQKSDLVKGAAVQAATGSGKRKTDWEDELELEKETLAYSSAATVSKVTKVDTAGYTMKTFATMQSSQTKASNKSVKVNEVAAKGTKSISSFFGKK